MSYINALEKALDYIEKHLNDDIDLSILAGEVGYSLYYFGHEVKAINHIPKDMTIHRLESSLYAVFRTIGPITESVQKTWDYIYTMWLNESKYDHAGTEDIEHYYHCQGELVADLYVPIL